MSDASPPPPAYVPTVYDETHRGVHAPQEAQILTLSPGANLIAQLEHHSLTTDGSVGICITTTGNVTAISKTLYESIPEAHRPPLNTSSSHTPVQFSLSTGNALGHVFLPLIFTDARTKSPVRVVFHALVMPTLTPPMYMSMASSFIAGSSWGGGKPMWIFDFGKRKVQVEGA